MIAGEAALKADCIFIFERTQASPSKCSNGGSAPADRTDTSLGPLPVQVHAAESCGTDQTTCQPRWRLLIKRKDPLHPGPGAELSQDGLSLLDWRPRWDCKQQMTLTAANYLTHVNINMLEGDATRLDKAGKRVEGTRSPADGMVHMKTTWAPGLHGLPSGIYAYCDANNVYMVDGKRAKLLARWSKAEILQPISTPHSAEADSRCTPNQQRLGLPRRPTAVEMNQIKGARWLGISWAPDYRALCCTARHYALILYFDSSLDC